MSLSTRLSDLNTAKKERKKEMKRVSPMAMKLSDVFFLLSILFYLYHLCWGKCRGQKWKSLEQEATSTSERIISSKYQWINRTNKVTVTQGHRLICTVSASTCNL